MGSEGIGLENRQTGKFCLGLGALGSVVEGCALSTDSVRAP